MKRTHKKKNSIQVMIIGIMALSFLLIFVMVYSSYSFVMKRSLIQREQDNVINQLSLAEGMLVSSVNHIPSFTRDWSSWDNTFDYVSGDYDEFLDDYLTEYPFQLFRVNFLTILDANNNIVYDNGYDFWEQEFMKDKPDLSSLYKKINPLVMDSFTDGEELDLTDTTQIGVTGFVTHDDNIYYLSSYPVIHSDETGPCVGSFTFGRIIDDTEISFLTSNLNFPFSATSIDKTGLSQEELSTLINENTFIVTGDDTITSYKVLPDIFGEPNIAIQFESSRELYQQGTTFIGSILLLLASGCISALLLILFLLKRIIVQPLVHLTKDVSQVNKAVTDLPLSTHYSSSREMYVLANSINTMLSRIRLHKETIEENNKQLAFHANYDTLTSLHNRFSASQQLDKYIRDCSSTEFFSVFFLNIDRFKNINDTMGHNAGDYLVMSVGKRLKEAFGDELLLARLGGDEFFIVSKNSMELKQRQKFVKKILEVFQQPFHVRHRNLLIDVSIGSSIFPLDGDDAETLIKNAEIAMHQAKKFTKSRHVAYKQEFHLAIERKVFIETKMRDCIKDNFNGFMPHFQPKLHVESGNILNCEALMRWELPEENISPVEFIPVAEESGLIIPLSWWMIETCCTFSRQMSDLNIKCAVAINISAQVILHEDFLNVLRKAVEKTGVDTKYIDIEIIESALVEDVDKINDVLEQLHAMNIEISVDDFGTGYSSLSYLNKMAVDRIKIDRSFITNLDKSKEDRALVLAIITMGKNLHMIVTAEGVEKLSEYIFLEESNCDEIQGYLITPALPQDEFLKFITNWHTTGYNQFLANKNTFTL